MPFVNEFIHTLKYQQLPAHVVEQAKYCVLDLLGVAAAGKATKLQRIVAQVAEAQFAGPTPMLFSSQRASKSGAAFYGAMLIDSMDAHDGQALTKGHSGVAILPGLLACLHENQTSGEALLTHLVVGYEIAIRAGIALHQSACDYHTSGAWNSLGVAAIASRVGKLSAAQTEHALGTAEFYGPRSQMMRCIEYPTMLKDGSGWGAMAGIVSAELAKIGFTGAPAVTVIDQSLKEIWSSLGKRWYILEQYFKPYPVCRWAQPAVEAVKELQQQYTLAADDIERVEVYSFYQAVCLHTQHPQTTEQAQYSLPFAIACVLMDETVSVQGVTQGLTETARLALSERVKLIEEPTYSDKFPEQRWAHVSVTLKSGQRYRSRPCEAKGNPDNPLTQSEMRQKFRTLASKELSNERVQKLEEVTLNLETLTPEQIKQWLGLLYKSTNSD